MFYTTNQTPESKQNLFRLNQALNHDIKQLMQGISQFAQSIEGITSQIYSFGKNIFNEYKNVKREDVTKGNFRFVPRTVEDLIGKKCARNMGANHIPNGFERWQEAIERVGNRLSQQLPKSELNFEFMIIENDRDINIYSLPGGKILFTTALLRTLEHIDENQLAVILSEHIAASEESMAIKQAQMELLLLTTKKISQHTLKTLIPQGATRKEIERSRLYEDLIDQGLSVGTLLLLNHQKQAGKSSVQAKGMELAKKAGFKVSDQFATEVRERFFVCQDEETDCLQHEVLKMVPNLIKLAK